MSKFQEITITKWSFAALLLSQGCLLIGCDAPPEADEIVAQSDDVANADAEDDEFRWWTGYTSEENPPLHCPPGEAVQGFDCRGDYCDNVALYCTSTGRSLGSQTVMPYFSEEGEGAADEGHCVGGDMWMTGVACRGGYCDDLAMTCTQMIGSWTGLCWWSGWHSEEQGSFYAPYGHFVKGIECNGDYCDNKRFYYCQMI
jgi:hypothetical protein